MTSNTWLTLFGRQLDPFTLTALALTFLVVILFIVMITYVARRSAGDAWQAVRHRPLFVQKSALPLRTLPAPTSGPLDRSIDKAIDERKSTGSLTILKSIAEEDYHPTPSSANSINSLLDEWNYLEVGSNFPKPAQTQNATNAKLSKTSVPDVQAMGTQRNANSKEAWWKTSE